MISLRREAQLMKWLIPETIRKLVNVSFLVFMLRLMTSLAVANGYHKHAPTSTSPRSTGFSV
jgi:hypothetical protein